MGNLNVCDVSGTIQKWNYYAPSNDHISQKYIMTDEKIMSNVFQSDFSPFLNIQKYLL